MNVPKLYLLGLIILFVGMKTAKTQINNLDGWRKMESDANAFKNIPDQYQAYINAQYPNNFANGIPIEVKSYYRFYSMWKDRLSVDDNGDLSFETFQKAAINYRNNYNCNSNDPANWEQLGPVQYTSQYMGFVSCLSFNPTNPDDILISSNHGGIWKSRTTGNSWENVSDDDIGMPGVSATEFVRDPYNSNHIYASTGDGLKKVKYGFGIIESSDNGETWIQTGFNNESYSFVVKIVIDYENSSQGNLVLYALTKKEVFKSNNSGGNWTEIINSTNIPNTIDFFDIQVKDETLFIGTESKWSNYGAVLYTYRNGILENTTQSLGLPDAKRVKITQTKLGKTFLLLDVYGIARQIYKSTNLGLSWYFLVNLVENSDHAFGPKCGIYYSEESNIVYSESIKLWYFKDDGIYNIESFNTGHADVRDIESLGINTNNEEELLIANDGGISKVTIDLSNISNASYTNLNGNYLPIGNYYGLGVNNRYGDFVVGGAVHIHSFQYLNNTWTKFGGGDGADCAVNPINPQGQHYYQNQFYMYRRKIAENGAVTTKLLHGHDEQFIDARFYINPLNPYELLMGSVDELAISDESNPTVVNVQTKPTPTELTNVRAISINNQNDIFISNYSTSNGSNTPNQFVKSIDNGNNWDDLGSSLVFNADGSQYGNISNVYGLLSYKSVNDIICNLDDSNEMWIGIGGIMRQPWPNQALPLNEKFRVLHSTDGGEEWYDYSEGLPAFPVKKMLHVTLDKDYLFIGTDVGVFYRTPDLNEWQCFQNGLPMAIVTDLEYDCCSNRLYVATNGRGIYYSSLPTPTQDIEINQNTMWNYTKTISTNVIVKQGATLTVTSYILMKNNTKIIVEPGAKLIVDGGTITNACDEKWAGIEVWGDETKTQTEQFQGKLEMYNATISHAHEAVQLWKPGDYSKTGGIIYAENSTFLNNRRAVSFLSYQNLHPVFGIESDYNATFKRCSFVNDESYIDDNSFYSFVSLWNVRGVKFRACEFDAGGRSQSAILSVDAGFKVESICDGVIGPNGCLPQDLERCEFLGFDKAISTQNSITANLYPINIQHAYFYNNNYGVWAYGLENVLNIKTSEFYIGNNGESKEKYLCNSFSGRGIHIQASSGFFIENNEFNKMPDANASDDIIGIVAMSNPSNHDIIYKNTFNDLKIGNKAVDNNRHPTQSPLVGIEYQCNENYNNYYSDFEVVGALLDSRINPDLGHGSLSARNKFSTNVLWHWRNMGLEQEDYYLHTSELGTIYEPSTNKIETTPNIPNLFNKKVATINNECPDDDGIQIERTTLTPEEQNDIELEFAVASNEYDAVESIYNDLKDGGNTETTSLTIETAQPEDTWELRDNLLGKSPYLSRIVLEKAANKTEVLPNSVLLDILAANPDELKKNNFISFLENKEEPLPSYMIDILRELSAGTTYKTALLNQMALQKRKQIIAAKKMINSLINEEEQDMAAIKTWLGSIKTINTDVQLASIFINEEAYTNANNLLDLIPNLYNLDAEALNLYQDDKYILSLKMALQQQNRNIMQLNNNEITQLEVIAENPNGMARASARVILESFYGYNDYCDCLNENETKITSENVNDDEYNNTPVSIIANPNPAIHYVEFSYKLSEIDTEGIIIITDINGKQIKLINVNNNKGIEAWDIRSIPTGSYIYTLKTKYFEESGKLIIQ